MATLFERVREKIEGFTSRSDAWDWLLLGVGMAAICMLPGMARGVVYGDWTSFGRIAALLLSIAGFVGLVWAWQRLSTSEAVERGRRVEACFEEHGLELRPADDRDHDRTDRLRALGAGRDTAPPAFGTWRGRRVRVQTGTSGNGTAIFEIDLSEDLPEELVIQPRSSRTMNARWVGWKTLDVGSEDFRASYVVRSTDPNAASRAVTSLELDTLFVEVIAELAPSARLESGTLRLIRSDAPIDGPTVDEHLETLRHALDELDAHVEHHRSRSNTPDQQPDPP